MQEKYAALLNKNLEDTSNLAKTLRNTKVHIYDKLRNSYQNANQLMQDNVYSPKNPPNGRVSNQNRFGGGGPFNVSSGGGEKQPQGNLFMNFGGGQPILA